MYTYYNNKIKKLKILSAKDSRVMNTLIYAGKSKIWHSHLEKMFASFL